MTVRDQDLTSRPQQVCPCIARSTQTQVEGVTSSMVPHADAFEKPGFLTIYDVLYSRSTATLNIELNITVPLVASNLSAGEPRVR